MASISLLCMLPQIIFLLSVSDLASEAMHTHLLHRLTFTLIRVESQIHYNPHEFTYLTQPTLTSCSLLFICFSSLLTSNSQASAQLLCDHSYFQLHCEVILYTVCIRDRVFFYDFRQHLGNADFLPSFQLKAKVSKSNNEAQCCCSIFQHKIIYPLKQREQLQYKIPCTVPNHMPCQKHVPATQVRICTTKTMLL